jgi:hypothetical protein
MENLVSEKSETVTLSSGERKELTFASREVSGSVMYLVADAQYKDAKSILGVRFVRDDVRAIRLNFPSLNSFPIRKDRTQTIFACTHSTNVPVVEGAELSIEIADRNGNPIHKYVYTGRVTGEMMGLKNDFVPERDYDIVRLNATLKLDGSVVEEYSTVYDCAEINPSLCSPAGKVDPPMVVDADYVAAVSSEMPLWAKVAGGLLAVVVAVFVGLIVVTRYRK